MLGGLLKYRIQELAYRRCSNCGSLIAIDARRDPRLLQSIYEDLPASYWQGLNEQIGFHSVIERRLRERGVLRGELWDVGCGNGILLANFSEPWTKHGIEPGGQAVQEARRRGLRVEIGTAATLQLRDVADVVLLIDVVEHLPDPEVELRAIKEMLRPGGTIVVFTGTADAFTARLAGSRWYYLHCVGHVTVFGSQALRVLLRKIGFVGIRGFRVEHPGAVGLRRWLKRLFGNACRRVLRRPPAAMHYYRDHQLVLATKPRSHESS